jgi:signal peptidase II
MEVGESFPFINNILNIHYIENAGASFGILKDHRWVFMSFSTVALILMCAALFYLSRKSVIKYNRMLTVALSLMFGGGVGNMIDRIFNETVRPHILGEGKKVVVDFLEFDFVNFAIFNFADVFITTGSALFFICIMMGKYKLSDKSDKLDELTEEITEFLQDSGDI